MTSHPQAGTRSELAGIKIADFTTVMAGPYCTRLLADLGADVIKIESPAGDTVRTAVPLRDGESSYFGMLNAGKRDIVLDLKVPQGRDAAAEIVAWADVVVENFRPGVMQKFGLDYDTVAANDPRVVFCSISGYGQGGPWIDRPATAQAVHAASGFDLAMLAFQRDTSTPPTTGLFVADALTGALAFGSVLAALRSRDATGTGGHIDLAMLDAVLSMMVYEVQTAQFPPGYQRKGYPPARTTDGHVMIATTSERHLAALLGVIGRPGLIEDPRFSTTQSRWQHTAELHEFVEEWTGTRTAAECERAMSAAGVPASRYLTVGEQLNGEQLRARGSIVPVVDGAGAFSAIDVPFRFRKAGTPEPADPPPALTAPGKGEHTREILEDLLGVAGADDVIRAGGAQCAEAAGSTR